MYRWLVTASPGPAPASSGCVVILIIQNTLSHTSRHHPGSSDAYLVYFRIHHNTDNNVFHFQNLFQHIRGRGCFYRSVLRVFIHVAMETRPWLTWSKLVNFSSSHVQVKSTNSISFILHNHLLYFLVHIISWNCLIELFNCMMFQVTNILIIHPSW